MAYADPFDASQISGATQAKLIDDKFRALHRALIERLNDKILVDATADPWVLKNEITGKKDGKNLTIPFINFITLGGGGTTITTEYIESNGSANALVAGFVLPVGVTIKTVGVYVSATSVVNLELYKIIGVAPFSKVSIAAWQVTTVGQQVSSPVPELNEVTDGLATYYISVDLVSTSTLNLVRLYGARVTYNAPAHLNTI